MDGKQTTFTNSATITGVPFNTSLDETYVATDEIKFQLTADNYGGNGILGEGNKTDIVTYDKMGLYAERTAYVIKVANKFSNPLKEIVLTEDASSFDSRLYVTSISGLILRGKVTKSLADVAEIHAYKSDGTYDTYKLGDALNKQAQDKLYEIAQKVNEGEIAPENVEAVDPE